MRARRLMVMLLAGFVLTLGAIAAAERDRTRRAAAPAAPAGPSAAGLPSTSPGDTSALRAELPAGKPVRAQVGDDLLLLVRSPVPDIAEVLELGLKAPVGPALDGAIRFTAERVGSFPVTLELAGTTAGTVVVRARAE